MHLFIFGCPGLVATCRLSLVVVSRACSSPQRTGVSSWWPLSLRSRALGSQASVVAAHGLGSSVLRLSSTGSVVTHGLSNSTVCGIFPDQGSNPCPRHWQADTYPRRHQSSAITYLFWGGLNPTYNQAPALHRMCEPGWGLNFIPKTGVATEVGVSKYVLFKNPFSREVGNTSEGSAWTPGVLLRGLFVWGEGLYPSWSHLGDWVNWEAVQKLFQQGAVMANVQFSTGQSLSRLWLCNTMDCSTPGLPVRRWLPEFTQTHHWIGDAIQPSHPLSPSPSAFNLSQHQGLFQRVSSSHQVAKVLELQLQPQSFQWIFKIDFL